MKILAIKEQQAPMKILVTGATGNVGRPLVEQLLEMGHQVLALTRNPAKANLPKGAEAVAGDLTNPATIAPLLEGVSGLHLINFGGDDYAGLQTGPEIVAMAEKAGVQRITVLLGGEKGDFEKSVESSKMAWTFLAPVEFMSGALDWADSIRNESVVRTGFADRRSAMVHDADIAAVAAVALTEEGHGTKTYTITGPEVLTPRDMVRHISNAIGRDIQFVALTEEEARAQWKAEGFPDEFIEFFVWAHGNTPSVGYTVVPTVKQVTGRPARTFAQWANERAADFR